MKRGFRSACMFLGLDHRIGHFRPRRMAVEVLERPLPSVLRCWCLPRSREGGRGHDRGLFLSEKTIGEEDSFLQMTVRLARVLSSTGTLTPFESLSTPLSTNDLRL